jgi:hypothetical protein
MSSKTSRFQVTQLFQSLVETRDARLDSYKIREDRWCDCGYFLQGASSLAGLTSCMALIFEIAIL